MSKQLKLIVATSKNGAIGRDGTMPWHLPDDLKYFKEKTDGSIIILGRKTFDTIGRVLPNREHWILTREEESRINKDNNPNVKVFHDSFSVVSALMKDTRDGYVIGGGAIYKMFLPFVSTCYVTEIETEITDGDTFFKLPNYFKEMRRVYHPIDEKHEFGFSFVTYERTRPLE